MNGATIFHWLRESSGFVRLLPFNHCIFCSMTANLNRMRHFQIMETSFKKQQMSQASKLTGRRFANQPTVTANRPTMKDLCKSGMVIGE